MSAYYRVNFEIANTEDLRQSFALLDAASSPVDLSGAVLKLSIGPLGGGTSIEASTLNGRIAIANAAAGQFEVAIPAATIATLPPGSYRQDLLVTLSSGHVHRVWTGALTLQAGVGA